MSFAPPPLPSIEPPLCVLCQERPVAIAVSNLAVCEQCREAMVRRPFPIGIKLVAAGVLIMMVVAFVRGQGGLEAALEFERGHRNELAGQYAAARSHYELADRARPGSPKVTLPLARCAFHLGDLDRAADLLIRLEGRLGGEEHRSALELQRQLVRSGHLKEVPARP